MKVLIKLGGTLLDSEESRRRLAGEIAAAVAGGVDAAVVHGGGKQMTRFLAERGIQTRFVDGLRVTTPDVLDAVLKIFAGSVNRELVAALVAAGARPVGLTGMDALLTEARQLRPELGFVGQPVSSDAMLPELLIEHGYLPVIACVAGDRNGQFYNVNADQMAASLAAALRVDKLLFLTDVEGVRGKDNIVYTAISIENSRNLIDSGIATGGMRAKLEAAGEALRLGVGEVIIAPGAVIGIVSQLLAGSKIGTRFVSEAGVHSHD